MCIEVCCVVWYVETQQAHTRNMYVDTTYKYWLLISTCLLREYYVTIYPNESLLREQIEHVFSTCLLRASVCCGPRYDHDD